MNLKELATLTKNLKILYVEDEKEVREQMGQILNVLFGKVDFAINGQDGLEKYKTDNYNLVLTDITMPKMNGLKLTEEIKKINPTQKVLIISAHTDKEFLSEAKKLGVNGFITKPLDMEKLFLTISENIS